MIWKRRAVWILLGLVLLTCFVSYQYYKTPFEDAAASSSSSKLEDSQVETAKPTATQEVKINRTNVTVITEPNSTTMRTTLVTESTTTHAPPSDTTTTKVTAATARAPRIFCMILTSPDNLNKKAIYIQQSWAYRCDGHKFVTVIPEEYIKYNRRLMEKLKSNDTIEFNSTMLPLYQPAGFLKEDYAKLTDKMYLMIMDVAKNYGDYDWYLKADDDTMIFVDNLREFLADKSTSGPFTYGYNFKVIVDKGYHSGGGGYVLPHKALHDLGAKLANNYSSCSNSGTEDVDVARCLRSLGYVPGSSLDEKNKERFHPLSVSHHYEGYIPDWLDQYSANGIKKGADCCSDSSISYHYMDPNEIMLLGDMLRNATRKLTFKEIAVELGVRYREAMRRKKRSLQ